MPDFAHSTSTPMHLYTRLLILSCLIAGPALGQAPAAPGFGTFVPPTHDEMPAEERQATFERLDFVADSLRAIGVLPAQANTRGANFDTFPVVGTENNPYFNTWGISNFVDQNPAFPNQILDYMCGTRTYDLPSGYNHAGVDVFTWPYGWHAMDNDLVAVVALAPGVILEKRDGHFDRNCTMGNAQWNAVYVAHDNGTIGWYGHLKNGSLTSKGVGDSVAAGEFLGTVGSSGSSTGPHLHFEIYAPGNQLVETFAGECNDMNDESYWVEQPEYYQSAMNALLTHNVAPSMPSCPDTEDVRNVSNNFERGEVMHMAAYYRDQRDGQTTNFRITAPSGAVWYDWDHTAEGVNQWSATYWYWSFTVPAAAEEGMYTIEAAYEDVTYTHNFMVGTSSNEDSGLGARLALDVFPNPVTHTARVNVYAQAGVSARVAVYDLMGREVMLLHDAPAPGDELNLSFAADHLAAGVYIVRAQVGSEQLVERLTILR